ncbi:MAG TPA: universal stress protein [Chitinophagales bacterium]|nr:universal stress protein [Chitinophagales bacterium]HRK26726.1 universal stress protein [Chitinophagales bacterium]
MNLINRLIVLVDFSEYSDTLVKLANLFAGKLQAEVVFVHQIAGLAPAMADINSRNQIIHAEKKEALEQFHHLLHGHFNHKASYIITEQNLLPVLHGLSNNNYFNWVLVGLKGTGLLKQLFIGSTAIKIVDESDLLTIAMPLQQEVALPKRLAVAVSSKYPINKEQLNGILQNLSSFFSELVLLTIIQDATEEPEARQFLTNFAHEYAQYNPQTQVFTANNAFETLKNFMELQPHTYLVVQQGSRTFTDTLFRSFMINELVYHGSIPLIVLSS